MALFPPGGLGPFATEKSQQFRWACDAGSRTAQTAIAIVPVHFEADARVRIRFEGASGPGHRRERAGARRKAPVQTVDLRLVQRSVPIAMAVCVMHGAVA